MLWQTLSESSKMFLQKETSKSHLGTIRKNVNAWLKDRKIKAFFSVTQDESFSVGAKNCMNLVGIGKCEVVVFQVTGSGRSWI